MKEVAKRGGCVRENDSRKIVRKLRDNRDQEIGRDRGKFVEIKEAEKRESRRNEGKDGSERSGMTFTVLSEKVRWNGGTIKRKLLDAQRKKDKMIEINGVWMFG